MPVELSYFDAASTDACTFGTDGTEVMSCTILSLVVLGDVIDLVSLVVDVIALVELVDDWLMCATTSMMPDPDEHATVVTNVGVLGPSSKDIELEMPSNLTCIAP